MAATATPKLRIIPTAKQRETLRAIKRRIRYILTGGAISTAKSYGLAQVFISMAMQFPRTRYGIFRRNLTVLKRTTYQTFRKVAFEYGLVEGEHYKVNRSEMYWEFTNGAQIWFMELDETKDPDFNKVKGLELTAAGIDEVNEVTSEGFDIVGSRVGRENHHDEPQFVLATCNPADNWVKQRWYTPYLKDTLPSDHAFIPSLPRDNPHNSREYLEALDRMPIQFKKRYVEGNWDWVDDSSALFPNHVIDRALTDHIPRGGQPSVAADVAREGDDNNVFAALADGRHAYDLRLPDIEISDETPILNQVTDEFILFLKEHKAGYEDATVDAVGLGSAVVDNGRARGYFFRSFKSGEKATDLHNDGRPKYDNLRSQRYWEYAQALRDGSAKIWSGMPNLEELRKDLLAHTFTITDTQIIIESKKKMKKRLHRSPDYSDAVVMAYRPKVVHTEDNIEAVGNPFEGYDDGIGID